MEQKSHAKASIANLLMQGSKQLVHRVTVCQSWFHEIEQYDVRDALREAGIFFFLLFG